jgi:glycosyltransferase involved in cell wall biosynthesis
VVAKLGVHAASVVTVPNGVDFPDAEVTRKSASAVDFALYVGGHEPRKNVAGVLRAVRSYWRRYDRTLELRLTGHARSLSPDAAAVLSDIPTDAPIRFLGDVSDAELAHHYSTARLLLLLSHEEGFGLPVLEAMAYGCPVVAANRTSLPEVVGDAGLLVDAGDADGVADTMRRLLAEDAPSAEFASRGRARARDFGWDLAADRMRAVYESALATDGPGISGSLAGDVGTS